MHDTRPMALPSRDVTNTFIGPVLGMASREAERRLTKDALAQRKT